MLPVKWLILGAFIAGIAVATVVTTTANNSTSGCDFLGATAGDDTESNDSTSGRDQPGDTGSNTNAAQDDGTDTDDAENVNGATGNTNVNAAAENANGGSDSSNQNNNAAANENTNSGAGNENGNTAANENENGEDTTGPAITGQFAGTLVRENAQSLGGDLPAPRISNSSQAMEFGEDFRPLLIMVLNYAGAPDRPLTNVNQGDTQTINTSQANKQITLEITVREASYRRRGMRAVLDIDYRASGGNLTETGSGEQIIECSVDADGNLAISSAVHYEIRLTAGAIVFNTIEETRMTGTLRRE